MATYTVVVERDLESGWYVGSVPALPGCYSQAPTIEELDRNIQEAIELHLEHVEDLEPPPEFVEIRHVSVAS